MSKIRRISVEAVLIVVLVLLLISTFMVGYANPAEAAVRERAATPEEAVRIADAVTRAEWYWAHTWLHRVPRRKPRVMVTERDYSWAHIYGYRIWISTEHLAYDDQDLCNVMVHEMGHSIGLKHDILGNAYGWAKRFPIMDYDTVWDTKIPECEQLIAPPSVGRVSG